MLNVNPLRWFTLLAILFLFLPSSLLADVLPDGSYSKRIELKIPAGTQNMQPELALSYHSQAGNGMLGQGWNLAGLDEITRVSNQQGIAFDANDSFAGQDGLLVSMGNGLYFPKSNNWTKYEAQGSCGNGPCSWVVTDRAGG